MGNGPKHNRANRTMYEFSYYKKIPKKRTLEPLNDARTKTITYHSLGVTLGPNVPGN